MPKKKTSKKASCKAVNQKDKCIVYTRTHKEKSAAIGHAKNIRARGGKVSRKSVKKGIELTYSFPKKKK